MLGEALSTELPDHPDKYDWYLKYTPLQNQYSRVTDIQGKSQTLYTTLCNDVVTHGAQIWEYLSFC